MNLVRITQQTSILVGMISTSILIHIDLASAQQKTCVMTDEGSVVCGRVTTQTKKPSQNSGYRKEVNNFVFVLKDCRRSDTSVKCNFTITNKEKDRHIIIWADKSKIVDLSGKSYYASQIELDGENSTVRDRNIASGIEYAASLTFNNIPDQITKSQLLLIGGSVQFRNISILN